jgi:CRP/FNR family cyclic AMP-dependent transcriptional regulator
MDCLRARGRARELHIDLRQTGNPDLCGAGHLVWRCLDFRWERRTHDAYAHGDTTILCVARGDLRKILSQHVELYEAMLRLHARRIRQLFGLVEDLNTLPLRARLAKQLLHLVRSYGVPSLSDGREMRIGLQLAQEELAQLLGASRQRVNQELKAMERENAIRIEPGGLVVRHREALMRIIDADK